MGEDKPPPCDSGLDMEDAGAWERVEGAPEAAALAEVQETVRELRGDLKELRTEVQKDLAALRGDLGEARGELQALSASVAAMWADVARTLAAVRADMARAEDLTRVHPEPRAPPRRLW
jgi:TolA-binding protein